MGKEYQYGMSRFKKEINFLYLLGSYNKIISSRMIGADYTSIHLQFQDLGD